MTAKVYGLEKCDTCKKARNWLQRHKVEHCLLYTSSATRIALADGSTTTIVDRRFSYSDSALLEGIRIGPGESNDSEREVWITNGTTTGTQRMHNIWPDTRSGIGNVGVAAAVGDTLYFTHGLDPSGASDHALWRTDGTDANTTMLPRAFHGGGQPASVQPYGPDGVLFATNSAYNYNAVYRADAALTNASLIASGYGAAWLLSLIHI